uniref:DUF7716 domain-containing protein n=1 Tax=Ningiella ruwaisensis TaxID=2364274 RepID=UPI0010A09133|nr:hypothetical protein [Ningiella ruwaisensis]
MRLEQSLEITLNSIDNLPWDHQVFITDFSLSNMGQLVLVIDDDEEAERDLNDDPVFATSRGFRSFLSVKQLQEIKENLVNSEYDFSVEKFVEAILYYHKYDAFIRQWQLTKV